MSVFFDTEDPIPPSFSELILLVENHELGTSV